MTSNRNELAVQLLSAEAHYDRVRTAGERGFEVAVALGKARARWVRAKAAFEAAK